MTDEDIKNLRDEIIKSKNKDKKILTYSSDFYSLSTIRDLLLHVKEHTFNINQIKNILKKLNLQFCGFEDRELINLFNKYYNGKEDIYNLEIWNDFELKIPEFYFCKYVPVLVSKNFKLNVGDSVRMDLIFPSKVLFTLHAFQAC